MVFDFPQFCQPRKALLFCNAAVKVKKKTFFHMQRIVKIQILNAVLSAFVFIYQGTTVKQLIRDIDWLKGELRFRKRDVGFVGETSEVLEYAMELLTENLVIKV